MTLGIAIVALVLAVGCGAGWWRTERRLVGLERRTAMLEGALHDRVLPDLDRSVRRSEAAVDAALEVRRAVGIEDPPPRLAGERITGPLVRAVAVGAGARRVLQRLAADLVPGPRRRQR
ncbi:MAG: hypothetical protein WCI50_03670 [Actinomycetes bacterium]